MTEFLHGYWPFVLTATERAVSLLASAHAVLKKRDTRAVIGWVGLICLVPFLGALLYYCFGINRLQRRGGKLQQALDEALRQVRVEIPPETVAELERAKLEYPQFSQMVSLVHQLTDRPLLPGNHIEPLFNGDKAYSTMLEAIHQAQHSVSLETYIFDNDRAGKEFMDALFAVHQRGVEVRVLVDDVGSRYTRPTAVRLMQRRGIPCKTFLRTRVPRLAMYANLRNHRKILVVDGEQGFTGGMNIRRRVPVELVTMHPVQDVHFRLCGPVVTHLQEAFIADWAFTTGEVLSGKGWLPVPVFRGDAWARGISDGPDEDFENLLLTILGAISISTKRVVIMSPYFLPDTSVVHAWGVASLRGVDVTIVLPERNNLRLVQWASMAMLSQVIERGCRVVLSPPPFDHSKLMLVDDSWVLFGSSNWDPRSLRLNFEFNVECYSLDLTDRMHEFAQKKIADSRQVTLESIEARTLPIRLRDGLARLCTPYL